MSTEDQLKSLTPNEKTVLYWKCKGLKYKQIAGRLGYSVEWVTLQMGGVYTKLGFNKEMHWTERDKILMKDVYPFVPDDLKMWINKEEPVIEITEETAEEIKEELESGVAVNKVVSEPKIDPQIVALVLYDEKMIEAEKEKSLIPPKPKETIIIKERSKGMKTFSRFVFALISAIILSLLGIFVYNLGVGDRLAPQILVVTATFSPATETAIPTPTSAVPTDTLVPTIPPTPIPTNTLIPTAFVPPADGTLFQDDFESGDLSAWTQYSGSWFVANGELTMLGDEGDYYE